jgi:hypothetical protein
MAGGFFAMFSRTIKWDRSCRTNAPFLVSRLFWQWQPEQRGPLEQGPALAAEVVKNCGGKRAQLFNIAGNNRFILVRDQRQLFSSVLCVSDCSLKWRALFILRRR